MYSKFCTRNYSTAGKRPLACFRFRRYLVTLP